MAFLIIGIGSTVKNIGWHANVCPRCGCARPFKTKAQRLTLSIFMIPIPCGPTRKSLECDFCGQYLSELDDLKIETVQSWDRSTGVAGLAELTNPDLDTQLRSILPESELYRYAISHIQKQGSVLHTNVDKLMISGMVFGAILGLLAYTVKSGAEDMINSITWAGIGAILGALLNALAGSIYNSRSNLQAIIHSHLITYKTNPSILASVAGEMGIGYSKISEELKTIQLR